MELAALVFYDVLDSWYQKIIYDYIFREYDHFVEDKAIRGIEIKAIIFQPMFRFAPDAYKDKCKNLWETIGHLLFFGE